MSSDPASHEASGPNDEKLTENEALAFDSFKRAADAGHADAAYYVAKMYMNGTGCSADYDMSLKYARQAADAGHADAMALTAILCLQANIFFKGTAAESLELLHKAAKLGSPLAYASLGYLYTHGLGVPRDTDKGSEYLCLAAGLGDNIAESMLVSGTDCCGWPRDAAARRDLLSDMAETNNEAMRQMAAILAAHDNIGDEQILQCTKLLAEHISDPVLQSFLKAAASLAGDCPPREAESCIRAVEEAVRQGVVGAAAVLASVYLEGRLVPRNTQKAAELLQRDVSAGSAQAMYMLSRLYDAGQGVPADPDEAWRLCRMAADKGYADAQFALGQMYRLGHNTERDLEAAADCLRAAADADHPDAMYVLAFMYYRGEGVPENVNRCLALLNQAAELGHLESMVSLGEFYSGGLGVAEQPERALKWLRRAAKAGHKRAIKLLKERDGL